MEIYPSIISSDLLNLARTLKLFDPHCDGYHIDIMDDHFVPNLTWGHAFVNAIVKVTPRPLNIHLMITNPDRFFGRLELRQNCDYCVFHIEAFEARDHVIAMIEKIKARRVFVGIAINPGTNVEVIEPYLGLIDSVLVMSVNPGFSGQVFISQVLGKVKNLVFLKEKFGYHYKISIDGGINLDNISQVATHGAEECCIASAIFEAKNPLEALEILYRAVNKK